MKKSGLCLKNLAKGLNQLTLESKLTELIKGLKNVKPNIGNISISYRLLNS